MSQWLDAVERVASTVIQTFVGVTASTVAVAPAVGFHDLGQAAVAGVIAGALAAAKALAVAVQSGNAVQQKPDDVVAVLADKLNK